MRTVGALCNRSVDTVKIGEEAEYERWLRQMLETVSRFPGYLGSEIFQPAQETGKRTSVLRFDSNEHLDAWVESDIHNVFVERVKELVQKVDIHEIMIGIDFSFTPEIQRPKPWKQFLISLSAVYPLTLVIPMVLNRLSRIVPFIRNPRIKGALAARALVALLVFLITPLYTRLTRRWLYNES
jgi:antibiotic biosynthesis monooxygenase (ABM) superfamily enzyme